MQRFCAAVQCLVLGLTVSAHAAEPIPAKSADGRVLNLGFEDGTLADWTASGPAFANGQPVKGDTVSKRRSDMKSNHVGEYWAGSFEAAGDDPKGTLTSAPFKVSHRWASFYVGGGPWEETRVELLDSDGKAFFRCSGWENEGLRPVVVDLEKRIGQSIQIRLVDDRGGHWGHINFDAFAFYNERPSFKDELVPNAPKPAPPPVDVVKFAGLSPDDAVKAMTLPQGFRATVFSAEPDVVQPVAFAIDHRGRLWVVECLTYPVRAPEGQGKDRILIFEDVDGDGKADKHSVFAENLNLATGIELGFGGVFVGAAPNLLFIPDRDGDDKPDGPPEVLLDGWGYQDTHETLNTFTWGPDGWLYGCHGVFTHSAVGKPGTPADQRVKINAGIWRYHPTKKTFEVFAEGTSNPWGIDFDEDGQLWAEACVVPHLWHMVQGGRFQRQAGQHFNPYTYDDIKQSADHVHYPAGASPHSMNGRSDAAGGGHAHAGLMIYNAQTWPFPYRGQIFIGNVHGQRINMDKPETKGSGYVAKHGADFLNFNDTWSQVINFKAGPDGNVYFIDWYDAQQCHVTDPAKHDRGNGRIYKVSYGSAKPQAVDLSKLSSPDLIKLQLSDNEWEVRMARRLLQERAAEGKIETNVGIPGLEKIARNNNNSAKRIRAMTTLKALGKLSSQLLKDQLITGIAPNVTGWAVQLLCEDRKISSDELAVLVSLSKEHKSPTVHRYIASAMQRLPLEQRWDVMANLLSFEKDAGDHNLPLLYWYAVEPLAAVDAQRAMKLAIDSKVPPTLQFMTRRIASMGDAKSLTLVAQSLASVGEDDTKRLEMLRGLAAAFAGLRDLASPPGWEGVEKSLAGSQNAEVRSLAQSLSVMFGSRAATERMRKTLAEGNAPTVDRVAALDALVRAKDASAVPVLQSLLKDENLRGPAIRGLAAFDDPKTPELIIGVYNDLPLVERRDILNTLASRPKYAEELFAAIDAKKLSAGAVTADVVRQLRNLGDKAIDERIAKVFQTTRQTPEEKLKQIAAIRAALTTGEKGDAGRGRAVFARTCQQCHTLFDAGGNVGPNITGANRTDLDYLLVTILDPNALIPAEYQTTVLQTADGRVLSGILASQDANSVTLKTANETVVLARKDVRKMRSQELSMMPEGLFEGLTAIEQRDLIAYLQSDKQVPLPATKENAKAFFNGKDLTGWWGREDVFKVENGELVGKTEKGLGNNEFLKSNLSVKDFRLTFKMKLVPNKANSGVQIRSVPHEGHEMKGYQCDAGEGWWGKIYHESGRGLLTKVDGDPFVKKDDWNTYEILAIGHKIKTAINGNLCSDLDDPQGELEGIIAVQVHSGGPTEARWKDFELEVDPEPAMKTVK